MKVRELSQETYEKICQLYWVLESCWPDKVTNVYDWVFSPTVKPYPVANQNMPWRRPTFAECLDRQQAYDLNPKEFIRNAQRRSQGDTSYHGLHWYVVRARRDLALAVSQ